MLRGVAMWAVAVVLWASAGAFGQPLDQKFDEKSLFQGGSLVTPPPPPPPPAAPAITIVGESPPPPVARKLWYGGFEFGINGSQGNADVTNLRLGLNADRKTDRNRFHTDLLYTLSNQDSRATQNQAIWNMRDEILFKNSPWSVFTASQLEFDQFRAYELRVGNYAGLAYLWLKTDRTRFATRAGAGAVREVSFDDGPPDRWVPEAVLGYDFNRRLTDRQGFVSSLDVYPNLSQIGQFRVRTRIGYEILIDPQWNMVLRLGVQDRYDSNPGPSKRNDLNYFTTLMFKF